MKRMYCQLVNWLCMVALLAMPLAAPAQAAQSTPPPPVPAEYDSQILPEGYHPTRVQPTVSLDPNRPTAAPVLLLMDELPWGSSGVQNLLAARDIPYDIAGSAELPTLDLSPYEAVIILSVQQNTFYGVYQANLTKIEDYVKGGGYLELHAATQGATLSLPGGGTVNYGSASANWIVESAHPLVAGVPNPFHGTSASHNYFDPLPAGAKVIATMGSVAGGSPTLIEYPLGSGHVVAFGQTLEYGYNNSQDAGLILQNAITYLVMNLEPNVYLSPASQEGFGNPGETVAYEVQLSNLTGVTTTFDLAYSGNTWPVQLSPTQTGLIPSLATATIFMTVTVPADAPPTSFDDVTLTATSTHNPSFTDTAAARTYVLSGVYGYVMGSNEVVVVDRVLGGIAKRIGLPGAPFSPQQGALTPDGSHLYVTNLAAIPLASQSSLAPDPGLVVIDTETNTVIDGILPGSYAYGVAITAGGGYALATQSYDNNVSVINTSTRQVAATIPTGNYPRSIAVHPCLEFAYVNEPGADQVEIIDTVALTVTRAITGLNAPVDAVVSPFGHQLYVAEDGSNTIAVIDLNLNQVVERWPVSGDELSSIDIAPNGRLLYVSDADTGGIHALDALTGDFLTTIPVDAVWGTSYDVQFAPAEAGPVAYVTARDFGEVVEINTETHLVTDRVKLGTQPKGLAYFPAPSKCQVAAILSPERQIKFGQPGSTLSFTQRLNNQTTQALTFDLALVEPAWSAELSAGTTGLLAAGETFVFTVTAQVPSGALPGDRATLQLQATSGEFSATAELVPAVARPGYVFAPENDQIEIVDTLSHAATGQALTIPVPDAGPWRGALSPAGDFLYASLRNLDSVAVFDLAAPAIPVLISVGGQPHGITFTPDGQKALVANRDDDSLSVIDTEALTVTQVITGLADGPQSIAVNSCQDKVYLASNWDNVVTVLDGATLSVTKVITSTKLDGPWGIVVSPISHRAYVSNAWNSTITVIDTLNDTVIDNWTMANAGYMANLDISPDGKKLYVAGVETGWLQVVSTETGEVTGEIYTGHGGDDGMAWDVQFFPYPYENYAYVSSPEADKVVVIDTTRDQAVSTIIIPGGPRGLALFPEPTWCGVAPAGSFEQSATEILIDHPVVFTATITAGVPAPMLVWDFGDGAPTRGEVNPSHTYTQTGEFEVGLTIWNPVGQVVLTSTILVGEVPAGSFTQSAAQIQSGQAVVFTSTVSAGFPAPTLTWDFGDGSPVSHEPHPQHTFFQVGSHPVTLTLENQFGQVVLHGTIEVQNATLHLPLIMTKKP